MLYLAMKGPRKSFDDPSCKIQVSEVGLGVLGLGNLDSLILWWNIFSYVLRRGGIHLSTRVYLHSHKLCAILCGEL